MLRVVCGPGLIGFASTLSEAGGSKPNARRQTSSELKTLRAKRVRVPALNGRLRSFLSDYRIKIVEICMCKPSDCAAVAVRLAAVLLALAAACSGLAHSGSLQSEPVAAHLALRGSI